MSKTSSKSKKASFCFLLTVFSVLIVITGTSFIAFYLSSKSETNIRYTGIKNLVAEKIGKTVWGMEMSASNVFEEVGNHLDSPESVIAALRSKAELNPEVRGYFAAFNADYYPREGTWFEPYVHQTDSNGKFEVSLVGSARHNYFKSDWYEQAIRTNKSFWSDPYYYYDGTSMSGHYCTFVKPIFDGKGSMACVCGADMTFEWLCKSLKQIETSVKDDIQPSAFQLSPSQNFYTVVLDRDGSCIAHPDGTDQKMNHSKFLAELSHGKSGVIDMDVNGMPCTVYYGPIEHVAWSVAVIVPSQDKYLPVEIVGIAMLLLALAGMIVVWLAYRRITYETAA